jgi:predicted acylesterase/phospholipase RssA
VDDRAPLLTTTYLDWSRYTLCQIPAGGIPQDRDWNDALDSAIASASHPLAFPPTKLDRRREREGYLKRGFANLPDGDLRLWYTDGGIVNNEPLARCIEASGRLDRQPTAARLVLLVRSEGHYPPGASDADWTAAIQPRWTETVVRAFDILATHAVALDLLHVEQFNARIRWTRRVAAEIAAFLPDHQQCADQLHALMATIEQEGAAFARLKGSAPPDRSEPRSIPELFEAVLMRAAGLQDKREVDVAVVSAPPSRARSNAMLTFLERQGREERFAAGFHTMLKWIHDAPQVAQRVPQEVAQGACAASERRLRKPRRTGVRSLRLSPATRVELGLLAARVAAIGACDFRAVKRKPSLPRRA